LQHPQRSVKRGGFHRRIEAMMRRHAPWTLLCALLLAGCVTGGDPTPTQVAAAPVVVTGPPACAQPIRDYVALVDSDVNSGHLNRDVHRRMSNDLLGVRSYCSAGRVAPALADLAEIKRRYGYR
jgi:hypothetical protein